MSDGDLSRARRQHTIADAIRVVPAIAADQASAAILCDVDDPFRRVLLAALAAAAKYPEILDAVHQIAAMHAAERGG